MAVGGVECPTGADLPGAPLETPPLRELLARASPPGGLAAIIGLANDEVGYIIPRTQWDARRPFTYGQPDAPYGEVNSIGPEAAPALYRGLAAAIVELADAAMPAGVEVRTVVDDVGGRALVDVGVQAFDDNPDVAGGFHAAGAYGVPGAMTFVAWEDGEPVASAASYLCDRAVGVFGVGVVPQARRRGIGAAITVHAARVFPGVDLAWLHPSEMALAMYEGIGFRRVSDWEVWIRAAER
jgi:GNAT superfamily N-acetyltransferase